jgi:hypothetical protein
MRRADGFRIVWRTKMNCKEEEVEEDTFFHAFQYLKITNRVSLAKTLF